MTIFDRFYYGSSWMQWLFKESFLAAILHKLLPIYLFFDFKILSREQYKDQQRRRKGFIDERYIKIKKLKNKYLGKRCFIACTGPSLTVEDLESLKDEYVFGMNSICLIHDKTNWKPDFYGIQDDYVYEKVRDELKFYEGVQIFAPYSFYEKYGSSSEWNYFHISWAYHLYDRKYRNRYFSYFSDDCYATVYDGFTITYSLIQLAIYMGFVDIYLLGADCSYIGKQQHFIETGHYAPDDDVASAYDRLYASYKEAKLFADKNGVRIFNATRGGYLEIYPRVNLEDVLILNEKNKN